MEPDDVEVLEPAPYPNRDHVNTVARLRWLRLQRGWSAAQLSELTRDNGYRVARSILANLENDRRDYISHLELLVLAKVFQVHLVWLMTGEGPGCLYCLDNAPVGYSCTTCRKEAGEWMPTTEVL